MKKSREAAHCRAHIRRVLRQQAHEPERVQPGLLAHQQAEVPAAGPGSAMTEQAAARRLRDAAVRAVEQRRFEPQLGEHLCRIGAEATQNIGNRKDGTNADGGVFRDDTLCRPWPPGQR